MNVMSTKEKPLKILAHLAIPATEIPQTLVEILLTTPDEIYSVNSMNEKLKSKGVSISVGALVLNLLMFQMRNIIKTVEEEIVMKRKRGRPQLKFILNHDLISKIK